MVASGSSLRVVPGLGLDKRSWKPTLAALSAPVSSVVTLPGFGESARGVDLAPEVLAQLLLARLRTDTSVVLVGHSASSQIVAHAARIHPEIVRGLVLVGPTTDPHAGSWPGLARRWLATVVRENPVQLPLVAAQWKKTGIRNMWRAMDGLRHDRIDTTLAQVQCPVLVVRGPHDHICNAEWARSLSPTVVTLRHGAHMVPWTHGRATAAAIAQFSRSS